MCGENSLYTVNLSIFCRLFYDTVYHRMINNMINKVDPSIILVDFNKFQPADAKSTLGEGVVRVLTSSKISSELLTVDILIFVQ